MRGDAEGGKRQGEEEAGVNINLIPSSPTDTHAHKEEEEVNMNDEPLHQALLQVYEDPGSYPGIYNYIKSLECVESALLGGFYFHHYRLAVNVIGADAKGTMVSVCVCVCVCVYIYMSAFLGACVSMSACADLSIPLFFRLLTHTNTHTHTHRTAPSRP